MTSKYTMALDNLHVGAVPQLASKLHVNVYCFNFSAYIRYFAKVFVETNVNISNELNFSEVY